MADEPGLGSQAPSQLLRALTQVVPVTVCGLEGEFDRGTQEGLGTSGPGLWGGRHRDGAGPRIRELRSSLGVVQGCVQTGLNQA